MSTVAAMAAATPSTRDRYADFLRVASLGGVVVGHFLMAVVLTGSGASDPPFEFSNILSFEEWTRPATWILQVMPIFFAVGGFAHAVAWRSLRARGGGYADFAYARISRLVRPALVFVGVWLAIGIIVDVATDGDPHVGAVLQIAGQLLWFIGIYLIAAALAPAMLRAHERWGWRVLVVLVGLAATVDVVRLAGDVDAVKWLNFAFVWLTVHQLGFFYADGVADRVGDRRLGAILVGLGAGAFAVLVLLGPYGVAMVSYHGEVLSNLTPPTVALLAFATAQQGALLMVRPAAQRWLTRPRVWKGVIAGGAVAMTAYLWHFTALIAMYVVLYLTGAPTFPEPGSAQWWLWRLPLFAAFAVLVVALVAAFRFFDRPAARTTVVGPSLARGAVAAVGVVCAIWGMVGFAVVGFRGVVTGYAGSLFGVPVTAVSSAALVGLSAVLTWVAARPRA
ncbi:MAG: acyltransferase [Actinobacteria bacterium HGW-Actinobacteria-4]|nr:MAG: acyltransferase [Actinobacteria bacterium HGW-Actinobacteria-4]